MGDETENEPIGRGFPSNAMRSWSLSHKLTTPEAAMLTSFPLAHAVGL